jgi:dolichyl-phosphate-mannose--protein O-mannosyl transferase
MKKQIHVHHWIPKYFFKVAGVAYVLSYCGTSFRRDVMGCGDKSLSYCQEIEAMEEHTKRELFS